ncbi:MAG: hypothetical protein ACQESP_06120 [Candidatus Muiribacteriota bacterium]
MNKIKEDLINEITQKITEYFIEKSENFNFVRDKIFDSFMDDFSEFVEKIPDFVNECFNVETIWSHTYDNPAVFDLTNYYHNCSSCDRNQCVFRGYLWCTFKHYYSLLQKYNLKDPEFLNPEVPEDFDIEFIKDYYKQYSIYHDELITHLE